MNIPTFATKEETLSWLAEHKAQLKAYKKASIKEADSVVMPYSIVVEESKNFATKADMPKLIDPTQQDEIKRSLVINTTNVLDSHMDVHIQGIWDKSARERKDLLLLNSHRRDFSDVITDEVKASVRHMNLTDLGVPAKGEVQSLIFDVTLTRDRNPFMFEQYAKGRVKQHSVGMQYVQLQFCVNSEGSEWKEEKDNWDKYYPQILVNKERADELGFFWAVTEAKIIEGSAVVFGSNAVTPTLLSKIEPNDTQTEESDTQPKSEVEPLDNTLSTERFAEIVKQTLFN